MKKLIIAATATLFTIVDVQAQNEIPIGAKAGVNFANFKEMM